MTEVTAYQRRANEAFCQDESEEQTLFLTSSRGLAQLCDAGNAQRGEQRRPFDGGKLKNAAKVGSFAPYWGTVASIDAHWPILLPTRRPPQPPPPLTACHGFISVWSDERERGKPRNLRGKEEKKICQGREMETNSARW